MLSGIVVLDLMSGFDSFLEMEVYSHLRFKKKIRLWEVYKLLISEVDLLSELMAVPTFLGVPVPKTFYVYPALGTSLEVVNLSSEVVCPLLQE